MPLVDKVTLYPIHAVGQPFLDDEPFDDALLPAEILPAIKVEKITGLLKRDTFDLWTRGVASEIRESFANIDYAIVHRFRSEPGTGEIEQKSRNLVETLSALMRIIRPMRQRFFVIQGQIEPPEQFVAASFDVPMDCIELPEAHKLFHLRPRDLVQFRKLAPEFVRVMNDEYWSLRLAAQFHDLGHYTFQRYWKLSWFSWIAGLESLYTTKKSEHRGRLVAQERIKHVLGADTPAHEPGDLPTFLPEPALTVSGAIKSIYDLRNIVIHGKRVPDTFYTQDGRVGLDGRLRRVEELVEVLSFLLRKSIQTILEKNLVEDFKDETSIEANFSRLGLTHTELTRRREICEILSSNVSPMKDGDILQALNKRHTRKPTVFDTSQVRRWIASAVSTGQILANGNGTYSKP